MRSINKLTEKEVAKKTKPGLYGDGLGLTLQITPAGVKSWLYRYMINGRAYAMGLGPVHSVSLAEAREKAAEARKKRYRGVNPLLEKRRRKRIPHVKPAVNVNK